MTDKAMPQPAADTRVTPTEFPARSANAQVFETYLETFVHAKMGVLGSPGQDEDAGRSKTPISESAKKVEAALAAGAGECRQPAGSFDDRRILPQGFCGRSVAMGTRGTLGNVCLDQWDKASSAPRE